MAPDLSPPLPNMSLSTPCLPGVLRGAGPFSPELPLLLQVALLCGPPGLGKTTLAHVIAQHAGYCVVEMNARYMCKSGTRGFLDMVRCGAAAAWQ